LSRDNRRRLLLVNRRNRDIEITVPQAGGATVQYVDQSTGFQPPASAKLADDQVRLGGYAVAVVEFAR
jgi:hypothetical protein